MQNEYSETFSFRTIGGIIESKPKKDKLEIISLHPLLPVIEVHGFHCSQGYGSPVFDMGGKFVGFIMFQHCEMNYILPSNIIKSYISHTLASSDTLASFERVPHFSGGAYDGVYLLET